MLKLLFKVAVIILRDNHGDTRLPESVALELARVFLENIEDYMKTEEGKKYYESLLREETENMEKSDVL